MHSSFQQISPILSGSPVLEIPGSNVHRFSEWAQEYGDVFSLKILNRTIIVISSPTAVKSILETNGAYTGNRIRSALIQRGTKGSQMSFEDSKKMTHSLIVFLEIRVS